MINAFIEAHGHAQSQIALFFGEDESVDSPEEAYVIIESQCTVFEAVILRSQLSKDAQLKVNTMLGIQRPV